MIVEKEILITEDHHNIRIDRFLSENYKHISRSQWQERIEMGNVLVNGKKTRCSYLLKMNDKITFFYSKKSEPNINKEFKIIYEDEDLIVIDKPPNLPVHPSGNYKQNTLYSLLKEKYNYEYCHPIHRLDRETSGLIIFGKNPFIIRNMARMFLNNEISKIYYTIVFGEFQHSSLLEGYIGKSLNSKVIKRQMFIEKNQLYNFIKNYKNDYKENCDYFNIYYKDNIYTYRYSKTKFFPEKITDVDHPFYKKITLIKVQLYTGRTHQIRATLKDSGFPIVGDKIYGPDENYFIKFLEENLSEKDYKDLLLNRTALHCYQLTFLHPKNQQILTIQSPLPEDLIHLLKYTTTPA